MFEASSFAYQNNSQEFNIGLIDATIIRSAQKGGYLLWTLDERIISIMDNSQLYHLPVVLETQPEKNSP